MKYGVYYFKNTHNIGDDIWAVSIVGTPLTFVRGLSLYPWVIYSRGVA